MEKSKIVKYSCIGAGIPIILVGLLLVLIPSLTTPKYLMYKNGENVTNQYSLASNEEEYLKTVYSTLNYEEKDYFLLSNEEENIVSKINISSIYDSNFNEEGRKVSLNITFNFEYNEQFVNNINAGLEKISAYPGIYLSLNTNEKEVKTSSLGLIPFSTTLEFEEFELGNFNKDKLTDGYINVISEGSFETLTNSGENKTYDFNVSRIDLEFFAE